MLDPKADLVLNIGPLDGPRRPDGASAVLLTLAARHDPSVRRVVKRAVRRGAVVLVLGSLGIAAAHRASAADAKPTPPKRWDPRVAKYVKFVEQHRKLKFDHPVRVEFLADAAFVKAFQRDDPKITKQDRAEAERIAGELRAVGLIEGPVDLIESERNLGATDTVGFYDQERKALYVRGTDLTDVDVRITVVHELTHALQDQHFDLTKLDDAVKTEGEDFALTALIEGDATSIEDDYLFSLPQAEQDAYFAGDPDTDATGHEPGRPVVTSSASRPCSTSSTSGPYVFGSRYIGLLRQAGGEGRVDDAFAAPPLTEEEIVDPVAAPRRAARQAGADAEVGRRRAPQWHAERVRCVEPLPGAGVTPRSRALAARGGGMGRRPLRRLHQARHRRSGVPAHQHRR